MAHKTLIGGTAYDIKSGKTLIGGTGYDIKKGRTLIDGTGYDIKFATPLAELSEGSIIKLNEADSPVEFFIAKHNYESELNGAGRSLLVRKECYREFINSGGSNFFPESNLHDMLNDEYKAKLDTVVQTKIGMTSFKQAKIRYYNSHYFGSVVNSSAAVFALSIAELCNVSFQSDLYDGTQLPVSDALKIAYFDGSAVKQYTRSAQNLNDVFIVSEVGEVSSVYYKPEDCYARPVFTLPETMEVDGDFNLITE